MPSPLTRPTVAGTRAATDDRLVGAARHSALIVATGAHILDPPAECVAMAIRNSHRSGPKITRLP